MKKHSKEDYNAAASRSISVQDEHHNNSNSTRCYPKLWQEPDEVIGENNAENTWSETNNAVSLPAHIPPGTEESFHWARRTTSCDDDGDIVSLNNPQSMAKRNRKRKSGNGRTTSTSSVFVELFQQTLHYVSKSYVISQEFVLSTLFLAAHRCLVCQTVSSSQEEEEEEASCQPCNNNTNMIYAISLGYFALLVIVCQSIMSHHKEHKQTQKSPVRKGQKFFTRFKDGLLLAGILRLLSSLLRTLTASYSSDTVNALSVTCMIIHLITCDYQYANGGGTKGNGDDGVSNKTPTKSQKCSSQPDQAVTLFQQQHPNKDFYSSLRPPPFMGGTISINCVFFATTLLASRLSSDVTSYFFFIATITPFAFYPADRHNLMASMAQAPTMTAATWSILLVTLALAYSTHFLLHPGLEQTMFMSILFLISTLSPIWKACLYFEKECISGPWDIAHVMIIEENENDDDNDVSSNT